jgi:uncharacterized linocin/CFP29 family protein
MPRFFCTGIIRKEVTFIIDAADLEDAQRKAINGDWSNVDEDDAIVEDWKLNPETLTEKP